MGIWFFYNGNIARSVPVKKGVSVVVRPHSKVQIIDANNNEVQLLIKKGLFRRCGRPSSVVSMEDVEIVTKEKIEEVTEKSPMARKIAEKGVTNKKGMTPKFSGAKSEMTDSERKILLKKVLKDSNNNVELDEKSDSMVLENDGSVEVLSADNNEKVEVKNGKKSHK